MYFARRAFLYLGFSLAKIVRPKDAEYNTATRFLTQDAVPQKMEWVFLSYIPSFKDAASISIAFSCSRKYCRLLPMPRRAAVFSLAK